jgi:hypothetical protein
MARQFSTPKSKLDPKPQTEKDDSIIAPEFPDEWISIAAYSIWKNEGEPEGREADYWERAKAELTHLWQEGNLPTEWRSAKEER